MNPIYLKKSLIHLFMKQQRPDLAFEYVVDVHGVGHCVKFCIENDLYRQLLANFRKFRSEDSVGIVYQVILKNSANAQILFSALQAILNVQQAGAPAKMLTSYLR